MQRREKNPNGAFGLWLLPGVVVLISAFFAGCTMSGQEASSSGKHVEGLKKTPSAEQTPDPPERADDSKSKKNDSHKKDKKREEEHSLPAPEDSCDDLLVLVDRKYHLPRSYVPDDLVSLRLHGIPTSEPRLFLRREAAAHLLGLISAARSDGEQLVVYSAFRSYAEQQKTFAQYVGIYGKGADVVSARPGQSQHQLGTAVDFTNAAAGYKLVPEFGSTSASHWLEKNAPKYGFVLSYSNSSEQETGVQWEPWHYRYIGEKNAKRLEKSGLSEQSFLEQEGVRPRC